jgi:hypothetical protein
MASVAARKREIYPHAKYGVSTKDVPDFIEPFTAYRAWHWNEDGITSLNNAPWTPKVAFEAVCARHSPVEGGVCCFPVCEHKVPDVDCTCGMYAGINMQHLIDIGYIERGIHGEVLLWGRLYRHTLGWRAQYAYPKNFIVPPDMLPFTMTEIQRRMESLIAFDVDIYLQKDRVPCLAGEKIPFWMKDYGYSQQGIGALIAQREQWYADNHKVRGLQLNDRIVVLGEKGGIGIVKHVTDDDLWYTMFNPNILYRKRRRDFKWSDRNWRWETEGLGATTSVAKFMQQQ